jgi:hypothetical protein
MYDSKHDDLPAILMNLVDYDVGMFDQFMGTGIKPRAAHIRQFRLTSGPILTFASGFGELACEC